MEFPAGPVVKTPFFHCRGHGFNPYLENERSHKLCGMTKNFFSLFKTKLKFTYCKIISFIVQFCKF